LEAVPASFLLREVADFADQIDRTCRDDKASRWSDGAGLSEGGSEMWSGMSRNIEGMGGGEEILDGCGSGVIDGGEDDVVVWAGRGAVRTGIEEGEEDLGHLVEVFVAEAAEEEGTGQRVRELGDRGSERPGACGVVGDVEEEL
jgi:hypothetical protein